MKEGADSDIESEDVSPTGHELKGNEGTPFAIRHEVVESEDEVEFFEVGHEVVEVGVSYPVFQTGLG